ncbi:MAG: hypothetical protein JRJ38_12555 [Deltaproteobacteria bacterium]|nr:hypothetical protein [Deltaproteobacteria bacterium]
MIEDVEGIKEGVLGVLQDRDLIKTEVGSRRSEVGGREGTNKIRQGGFRTARKYDIAESRERFLEAVVQRT